MLRCTAVWVVACWMRITSSLFVSAFNHIVRKAAMSFLPEGESSLRVLRRLVADAELCSGHRPISDIADVGNLLCAPVMTRARGDSHCRTIGFQSDDNHFLAA